MSERKRQRYADYSGGLRQDRTSDLPIHVSALLPTFIRKFGGLFSSRSVGHSAHHHHGIIYFSTGGTQVHWSNRHSGVNVTSLACSNARMASMSPGQAKRAKRTHQGRYS